MNIVYMLSEHCAFHEHRALPTCGVAQSLVSYKHQRAQIDHMYGVAQSMHHASTRGPRLTTSPSVLQGVCVLGGILGWGVTSQWSSATHLALKSL
jgi:hypothetical protein